MMIFISMHFNIFVRSVPCDIPVIFSNHAILLFLFSLYFFIIGRINLYIWFIFRVCDSGKQLYDNPIEFDMVTVVCTVCIHRNNVNPFSPCINIVNNISDNMNSNRFSR